jgi:hypothetical protein
VVHGERRHNEVEGTVGQRVGVIGDDRELDPVRWQELRAMSSMWGSADEHHASCGVSRTARD